MEQISLGFRMEKLLSIREVCEFTGLGKSTVYELIQSGRFPKPLRIGVRAVRWRQSDLRELVEKIAAAR